MDLQQGLVVRGIAGRRSEYRPIATTLCATSDPIDVAIAFRDQFGLTRLYLADLDAIAGGAPAIALMERLHSKGFSLMIDAGIQNLAQAHAIPEEIETMIVGLETIAGPSELEAIVRFRGPDRILFSLDLKNGKPLGKRATWAHRAPEQILVHATELGVRRILLLDLARVGVDAGTGTEELAHLALEREGLLEVVVGGGVRGISDLQRLQSIGVHGVLVASALHDGKLSRAQIDTLKMTHP